jgi:hypothetical protein
MEKFIPRKRKKSDLDALLDQISALKSAILIKLRLEDEMKSQKSLIAIMRLKPIFTFITILVAPIWTLGYWKERNIKRIELERDLEVKVKARNKYHKNELMYEDALKQYKEEMDERFDHYFSRLQLIISREKEDSKLPYNDVKLLLDKHRETPPKDNQEKLEFYLAMESTLVLCMSPGS